MKKIPLTELANMDNNEATDWIIENQYDYVLVKDSNRVEPPVKPTNGGQEPEKIVGTESRSSTRTKENVQLIIGEFGTRIFIDWQNGNFTITKKQ